MNAERESQQRNRIRILDSLGKIAAADWNALEFCGNPFLRHEFLLALETQHCADRAAGWQSHHLLLYDEDEKRLLGAIPLYLKSHSWGEFVFDWSWASAYAQHGRDYYPKLTSAIPFTPASGPRLLVERSATTTTARETRMQLSAALVNLVPELDISSIHVLFAAEVDRQALAQSGFLLRNDCQFHWHNRDYETFDAFLATFRAEKRKKALRERRRVAEAGVYFEVHSGNEMTDELWEEAFALSAGTFARHGHEHYLNAEFFKAVARAMPETVVVICALHGQQLVGVAICFRGSDTLYGRYWGQAAEFHSLHFETCYFQGIEYCIKHGLTNFEPGTQGEHKIARGFEPTLTWSAHWLADRRFAHAIDVHLSRERLAVERYAEAMREHLPFHRTS